MKRSEKKYVLEAFIQISVLIIATFAFSFFLSPQVSADSSSSSASVINTDSQNYVCCEQANNGASCVNTYEENCNSNYRIASTTCEKTSFCRLGCCYDSTSGVCAESTPQKVCSDRNGTFDMNADCNIPQCSLGCCVLGDQSSLTTLVRCKKLAGFYGLAADFRSKITNELDCVNVARANEKGACVFEKDYETTCSFTTRDECRKIKGTFYVNDLCSKEELGTNCKAQASTGCVNGKDEVYWFDSCGNPENIYDANKARSYNNGEILKKEDSCNYGVGNANNPNCGNCDYLRGSRCGSSRTGVDTRASSGDYICRSLDCATTTLGKAMKHGESWCDYDSATGKGLDVVGSTQYRHMCVQGEEILESCADYRQTTCLQRDMKTSEGTFSAAACRANRWQDCLQQDNQADCEDIDYRDCAWRTLTDQTLKNPSSDKENVNTGRTAVCVPDVPPGLKFWDKGDSLTICGGMSMTIPVKYEQNGAFSNFKCTENCWALEPEFQKNWVSACNAMGDCGAKVNIVGKFYSSYAIENKDTDKRKLITNIYDTDFYNIGKALLGKHNYLQGLAILASAITGKTVANTNENSNTASGTPASAGVTGGAVGVTGMVYYYKVGSDWFARGSSGGLSSQEPVTDPNLITQIETNARGASSVTFTPTTPAPTSLPPASSARPVELNGDLGLPSNAKTVQFSGDKAYWTETRDGQTYYMRGDVGSDGKVIANTKTDIGQEEWASQTTGAESPGFSFGALTTGAYQGFGAYMMNIIGTAAVAGGLYLISSFVLPMVGLKKEEAQSVGLGLMSGFGTYGAIKTVVGQGIFSAGPEGTVGSGLFGSGGWLSGWGWTAASAGIGIGVGVLVGIFTYQEEDVGHVTLTCGAWKAPRGGADCEQCNNNIFKPCSEYRCKSLGAGCSIVNKGTTDEKCVWLNQKDVTPPTIEPWYQVITKDFQYVEVKNRPPGLGFRIINTQSTDKCLQPWTPLQFGVITNELSQCKIDYNTTKKFDDMVYWMGGSDLYSYNHTEKLSLPGPTQVTDYAVGKQSTSPMIQNDGKFTLYIRCQDANGNYNIEEYGARFCVQKSPDLIPPVVERTSIQSGAGVFYNVNQVPVTFYLNEPSQCKWSLTDKNYDDMENSLKCVEDIDGGVTEDNLFPCSGNLTDVNNNRENTYYVRCKDQPWLENDAERNINKQSYVFTLQGTRPINITSVSPTGIVASGVNPANIKLTAELVNGFNNDYKCYYSTNPNDNNPQLFFTNGQHSEQDLTLRAGSYAYYITCSDSAGNIDKKTAQFSINIDTTPPVLTRTYYADGKVKVVMDENSSCVYSLKSCNYDYDTGITVALTNSTEHYLDWMPEKTYYLKCEDQFGNRNAPSDCSAIVKAYEVSDNAASTSSTITGS